MSFINSSIDQRPRSTECATANTDFDVMAPVTYCSLLRIAEVAPLISWGDSVVGAEWLLFMFERRCKRSSVSEDRCRLIDTSRGPTSHSPTCMTYVRQCFSTLRQVSSVSLIVCYSPLHCSSCRLVKTSFMYQLIYNWKSFSCDCSSGLSIVDNFDFKMTVRLSEKCPHDNEQLCAFSHK